jgi:hypothetical protein
MFTPSSLSRKVIDAASSSGAATVGRSAKNGAKRSCPVTESFEEEDPMFVATAPGATALTRSPRCAYMNAVERVRPRTACLEAVYAAPEALPRSAAPLMTLTTEPRPASSMTGSTARVSLKVPVTFTPHHAVPDGIARLVKRREIVGDAGHIGQSMDLRTGSCDDRVDIGLRGDISGDWHDVRSGQVLDETGEAVSAHVDRHHAATLACYPGCCRATDTRCGARDDHSLAREATGSDLFSPSRCLRGLRHHGDERVGWCGI